MMELNFVFCCTQFSIRIFLLLKKLYTSFNSVVWLTTRGVHLIPSVLFKHRLWNRLNTQSYFSNNNILLYVRAFWFCTANGARLNFSLGTLNSSAIAEALLA